MATQPETLPQKIDRLKREIRDIQRTINNVAVEVYGPHVDEAMAHIQAERAKLGISPPLSLPATMESRVPTSADVNGAMSALDVKKGSAEWPSAQIYDVNMNGQVDISDIVQINNAKVTQKLINFPAPPH
jgi:hypothetical protein